MDELQKLCREIRKGKRYRRVIYPRTWSENDLIGDKVVRAFVFILKTRGCFWARHSGCTMCGYFNDSIPDITEKEIREQLEIALKKYNGEKIVKIFTSGSFLDEREVSIDLQIKILKKFFERADKISIESRPEFIKKMNHLEGISGNKILEMAMGLESANDRVLKYSINKGFTFSDWRNAAEEVLNRNMQLKTYILIKPPFLTEKEGIKDALFSVKKVSDISDTISFNPVAIHSNTLVDYLWKRGLYRPPWLWSVADVLEKTADIFEGQIKCDVVAGGKKRGAHNCGKCDAAFMDAVEQFTIYQNRDASKGLKCKCREEWLDSVEMEGFIKG
ncbi:MAG: archaeosine biosynthesis radical SAM protein RaSEA [Candidatus Thermoplasmatota archaeon]|nr:archaeosine biosynthesis radical SAM protein RaSEA [Candidatus Thermoplasmatota archaeon]